MPVWIIGNGPSQKKWKLKELDGFTYGSNNLYRHFTPDILLAVDPGAIFEIVNSGYKGQCRFSDWNLMLREYDKGMWNISFHKRSSKTIKYCMLERRM